MKYIKLATLTSFLAVSASTFAMFPNLHDIPDLELPSKKSGLTAMVGAGLSSQAEFVGSADNSRNLIPLINLKYDNTYYIKFNRLGADWSIADTGIRLGGELSYRNGWNKNDIAPTNITQDRDGIILAGITASYKFGPVSTTASLYNGFASNNEFEQQPGMEGFINVRYNLLNKQKVLITTQAKIEFLSADTVGYLYRTQFTEGFKTTTNLSVSIIGKYQVTNKWSLVGSFGLNSLGDEISDAAMTEDDLQSSALIGASYRF